MAKTEKKWYVLRAASGKEFKVKEYLDAEIKHNPLLQAHVSQVVLPLEKHASLRNGKRVIKEKISLPGYVFVHTVGSSCHTPSRTTWPTRHCGQSSLPISQSSQRQRQVFRRKSTA